MRVCECGGEVGKDGAHKDPARETHAVGGVQEVDWEPEETDRAAFNYLLPEDEALL